MYRTRRESQMAGGRRATSAAGAILFAGIMMIVVGLWEALEDLIAIFETSSMSPPAGTCSSSTSWAGSTCSSGWWWPLPAMGC